MTFIIILTVHQVNLSNVRKQQEEINKKANSYLEEMKFLQNKTFYLNDYTTYNQSSSCKKFISVDNENKKVCLINYNKGNLIIVGFDEILNYEVYENGSQQTIGAGVGGFWAGLFGAETNGICKDLKLIIRLKRYDISQINYDIIFNTSFNIGISKTTQIYKQCISSLQEVVSFLEVLKNENASR